MSVHHTQLTDVWGSSVSGKHSWELRCQVGAAGVAQLHSSASSLLRGGCEETSLSIRSGSWVTGTDNPFLHFSQSLNEIQRTNPKPYTVSFRKNDKTTFTHKNQPIFKLTPRFQINNLKTSAITVWNKHLITSYFSILAIRCFTSFHRGKHEMNKCPIPLENSQFYLPKHPENLSSLIK